MKRRLRWVQVDEQEHATSPETPAAGDMAPVTGPAPGPGRDRRGDGVRDVLTSRGAGWAVAAAMAGAVVGLSVAMATSSSPTVVVQPDGAAGLRGTPAGPARAALPGGALQAVAPGGRVPAQVPVRLRIQTPARLRIQVPAAGPLQAPGAVRLRIRPGQVRVRLRLPANGRLQVLPGGAVPGPLRVIPGPGQASLVPAALVPAALVPAALVPRAQARLRIAFRNGTPVRARLLIPASLPGQARLRIQVPARARIQVPAQAPITQAPPAPPNW